MSRQRRELRLPGTLLGGQAVLELLASGRLGCRPVLPPRLRLGLRLRLRVVGVLLRRRRLRWRGLRSCRLYRIVRAGRGIGDLDDRAGLVALVVLRKVDAESEDPTRSRAKRDHVAVAVQVIGGRPTGGGAGRAVDRKADHGARGGCAAVRRFGARPHLAGGHEAVEDVAARDRGRGGGVAIPAGRGGGRARLGGGAVAISADGNGALLGAAGAEACEGLRGGGGGA